MSCTAEEWLKWKLVFGINGGSGGGSSTAKSGVIAAASSNFSATYNNGVGNDGVGATLTATVTGVYAPDGVTLAVGDDVLFPTQTAQLQNGIYRCTTLGAVGVAAVFTRRNDFDTAGSIVVGAYTAVARSATTAGNAGRVFVQQTKGVVVGTTAIVFAESDTIDFSPLNIVYVSKNGNNTSGTGVWSAPFADPAFATNLVTGTAANPQIISIAPGIYSVTNLNIKPNVSYTGIRPSAILVSNPIGLDGTWSTAPNGSIVNFTQTFLAGEIVWDFSAITATSLGVDFLNSYVVSAVTVTGQDAGQIILSGTDTLFGNDVTLKSLVADFKVCTYSTNIIIDDKGSGSGTTTAGFTGCKILGNMSVSGASGRASTVTIKTSPFSGALTVDTTFVTINIDAVSYPVGGIIYTNGATSAQVNEVTVSNSVKANYTPANYTPTSTDVKGHLQGIDAALTSAASEAITFLAIQNVQQSIPNNATTKLVLDVASIDTAPAYNTTLYRYVPQIAGYYYFGVMAQMSAPAADADVTFFIYKNGAEVARSNCVNATGKFETVYPAKVISMNGSTDYVEVYVKITGNGAAALTIDNDPARTYFYGFLLANNTAQTPFSWTQVTGTSASMSANTGYIANNAALVTLTLPTTFAVGDTIEVSGKGAGGWAIAQNASQIIHLGNIDTTTGAGGSLASTNRRDAIKLIGTVANLELSVASSMGNITVV